MEVVRKNGYIAGIMSLVASSLFLIFTINFGWNLTGQALGVLTIFFGLLGIGSLWKPNSIGQIASQILENISKNMQESAKSDSHNKQTQKNSSGIQAMATQGGRITQNIGIQKELKLDPNKLQILELLNKEFQKNAHNFISDAFLFNKTNLSLEELTPHIKYLEQKGFINVNWSLNGTFICQITAEGIDIVS